MMKFRFLDLLVLIPNLMHRYQILIFGCQILMFGCQIDEIPQNAHFEIGLAQQKQARIEQTFKEIQIAWSNDISKVNEFQSKAKQSFSFLEVDLENLLLVKKYLQYFSVAYPQTQTEMIVLIDFYLEKIKKGNFTEKELAIQMLIECLKNIKDLYWEKAEMIIPTLLTILKVPDYPLPIKLGILRFFEEYGRVPQIQNDLNPFLSQESFFQENNPSHLASLRLALWRCFRKCLDRGCSLKIEDLILLYEKESQKEIKKEMILIATAIQSNMVLTWCGIDFWQNDFVEVCEKALSENPSQESFSRLENYLRHLLANQKKMNLYDIELAQKMSLLLKAIQNHPARLSIFVELSDLFFSKSRSSDSIYALVDLFEEIRPKREALSLFLRYEKWAKENFSNQPQGLMDRLRQGIRRLYED